MLNYITWDINRMIIEFGSVGLRWYGLLFVSTFIVGYSILRKVFKQEGLAEEYLDKLMVYMMIATVAGARLGHCLFYEWDYYSANPLEIIQIWKGGLASHGAAVGILFGLYLYAKNVVKRPYLWVVDRVALVVGLAGFFIRMGNLFNSEIYGNVTDVPWAFRFVEPYADGPGALPRHPTQIYEALCYLAIHLILITYYKKNVSKLKDGMLTGIFFVGVFGTRFLVEFFKANQEDFEMGMPLNMGQLLSIPLVVFGLYLLFTRGHAEPKNYLVKGSGFVGSKK